jgi:hypothetical protein
MEGRTLAVADFAEGRITWFPETQFRDASPMVDPVTGDIYWCWEYSVFRRNPDPSGKVERVNSIPESIHRNRFGCALATHLTLSADGKEFLIDAHLGREWCVGSLPVDGSEFSVWQTFDRCYDHGQFSPTDPDLALIAQDHWYDAVTGVHHPYENRLWLIRRSRKAEPVFAAPNLIGHEWWDPDGQHIWYVDYRNGTEKVNIRTRQKTTVWPGGTWHSHASADGRFLVGDFHTSPQQPDGYRVSFFNTLTGREINIVSKMPFPQKHHEKYHVHPHPQFCLNDTVIVYTTTVNGNTDIALAKTNDLAIATS